MATLKYLPQYFATTLNVGGGIDSSQTTGIVLQSVSGVDITKPGQVCISYSDPLDTGVAEWINYTSINGSNELVGVTRGCEGYSAHSHLPGAVIQFTMSATHINDLNDIVNGIQGRSIVTTAGGTTTYTLTPSPAITAYATGQEFVIKMNATNTGASTINVSALGAKSLTKGGATALASGDLLIDAVYKIVYDGTQFQVSGISGVTASSTDSFTNKTITDSTNNVMAKSLKSATTTVDVSAATAPSSGQVLTATGTTTATWQTPASGLSSKIIAATRDMTAATGNVSYTGAGFVPTAIIAYHGVNVTRGFGVSIADSAKTVSSLATDNTAWNTRVGTNLFLLTYNPSASDFQYATIVSYDADGFTLAWTKSGSPTGTMSIFFLCFR